MLLVFYFGNFQSNYTECEGEREIKKRDKVNQTVMRRQKKEVMKQRSEDKSEKILFDEFACIGKWRKVIARLGFLFLDELFMEVMRVDTKKLKTISRDCRFTNVDNGIKCTFRRVPVRNEGEREKGIFRHLFWNLLLKRKCQNGSAREEFGHAMFQCFGLKVSDLSETLISPSPFSLPCCVYFIFSIWLVNRLTF